MIILNCPKCSEPVTAAPGIRPTSVVRCPLCHEEYSAADALGKLPPALIVIDGPGMPGSESPADLGLAPSADAAVPAFAITTEGETRTATPAGPRVVGRPRPRRKPKNPVVEVIKIVGGGAAGLVIAIFILFWFPIQRFRRDPLDIGPKIGSITWLRFLVPSNYWPNEDESTADGQRDAVNRKAGNSEKRKGAGGLAPNASPRYPGFGGMGGIGKSDSTESRRADPSEELSLDETTPRPDAADRPTGLPKLDFSDPRPPRTPTAKPAPEPDQTPRPDQPPGDDEPAKKPADDASNDKSAPPADSTPDPGKPNG